MPRPGPRRRDEDEKSQLDLERENETLKRLLDERDRKVEFLEEELRVARHTQQSLARRASYGTGYQQ